eukprot:1980407-Prymnesium_polylepis.1
MMVDEELATACSGCFLCATPKPVVEKRITELVNVSERFMAVHNTFAALNEIETVDNNVLRARYPP